VIIITAATAMVEHPLQVDSFRFRPCLCTDATPSPTAKPPVRSSHTNMNPDQRKEISHPWRKIHHRKVRPHGAGTANRLLPRSNRSKNCVQQTARPAG